MRRRKSPCRYLSLDATIGKKLQITNGSARENSVERLSHMEMLSLKGVLYQKDGDPVAIGLFMDPEYPA
ncbi:hypothetical protein HS088_TW10G00734 [Tripterygium wilfordii]|uniref:Uncharacterized protein n=1 Tax=Tripterygium wilfordii TaxID=458696 RepID=A0A7J7D628_TRIWF|nr:hypothetical protein HS088_TW10G00734 [Tripterygium wilfordii]